VLTIYDILDPQRNSGAPIINIRHMDDWMERGAAEGAGVFISDRTWGESGCCV